MDMSMQSPSLQTIFTYLPERVEASITAGPLAGKKFGLKDNIDRQGEITTQGSLTHAHNQPSETSATCLIRLEQAGAFQIGRTNLSPFAFSGLGVNPHFGTPPGPVTAEGCRVPGGSSAGSAVAVRLGWADFGIGTDTSGSVRVPAAVNGIFGYKPTQSRIPRDGIAPLAPSLDTVGSLARDIDTAIAAVRIMAGEKAGLPDLTIPETVLIPSDLNIFPDYQRKPFQDFVQRLKRSKWKIAQLDTDIWSPVWQLYERYGSLVGHEALSTLGKHVLDNPKNVDPNVKLRLSAHLEQFETSAVEHLYAAREKLLRKTSDLLQGIGLLTPTISSTPPLLKDVMVNPTAFQLENAAILRNTMPASFLDLPGITLPIGGWKKGLRASATLYTARNEDLSLEKWALALNSEIPFSSETVL